MVYEIKPDEKALVIIKTKSFMSKSTIEFWNDYFSKQRKEGTLVIPANFDAMVITGKEADEYVTDGDE